MIPLIIQDQFYTIQNLQRSPIPQTRNWSGTFFLFLRANQLYNFSHQDLEVCELNLKSRPFGLRPALRCDIALTTAHALYCIETRRKKQTRERKTHLLWLQKVLWLQYEIIQTCSPPQNGRLYLSFEKGVHVVGGKMAKNGHKSVIYEGHSFQNSL